MTRRKFHIETRTKFSRPTELSPGNCAPLVYVPKHYAQGAVTATKDTRKERTRKWQRQWEETRKGAITK
jgi:hypothetical protein